jgi:hypothetical protein
MAAPDAEFAAQVADPRRHAVVDFSPDANALLVLFGGIAGGVSMPVYEFFQVTAGYPAKRLFLRDPRRSWYLRGLPGVGDDAASLERALGETIRQSGCQHVVMAGASAGGFAALRFGARLGVDRVLAFSPQSFVDRPNRLAAGDDRWAEQIAVLHAALGPNDPTFDLLADLRTAAGPDFAIHVSADDALDLAHARRLLGIPNLTVHEHSGGGHKLVKWLRDTGSLRPLLTDALAITTSAPT